MATEETTISELELADELLADMNIAVDTASETRAITLKQLKAWLGSSLPTGFVVASVGKINDERLTLLDGKTLSRVGTYEAFCNKVVAEVKAGRWTSCTEDQFNQEVSQTGQCNKFVVTNDYVRIPKFGNCMYSALIDGKIPVAGNGNGIGLYNGNGYGSWMVTGPTASIGNVPRIAKDKYGTAGTDMGVGNGTEGIDKRLVGLTTDASKSGIEGTLSTNPMTIYYYMVVSTEGQTASVDVDINKVYEDLELKANSNLSNIASNIDYVVETYRSGASWYRKYKSGWVEQGGTVSSNQNTDTTLTFLKKFIDTNYTFTACHAKSTGYTNGANVNYFNKKNVSITVYQCDGNGFSWNACGKGA